MRIKMFERGSIDDEYRSYMYFLTPIMSKQPIDEIFLIGKRGKGFCLRLMFNTYFNLTSSNTYVLIQTAILGFGFEFFVKSK